MSLFVALSPLLMTAASAPVDPPCAAIPGWEQVLADEAVRFVVLGEVHGTNEMPAIFADAVCLTAQSRPVVVALELPSSDQEAIDGFIASDGGPEAKRAFLGASLWHLTDGRSSEAVFRLFEALRQMRHAGRIRSVSAFLPSRYDGPGAYERAMADVILEAGRSGATVLTLVGDGHALRTELPFQGGYMPMASHLPAEATLTLSLVADGGEAWTCQGAPVECGLHESPVRGQPPPRGVELNSDEQARYSGVIHLGGPTTASPPQAEPAG